MASSHAVKRDFCAVLHFSGSSARIIPELLSGLSSSWRMEQTGQTSTFSTGAFFICNTHRSSFCDMTLLENARFCLKVIKCVLLRVS